MSYVLVASALATAAALVHREFRSPQSPPAATREARYVKDWGKLAMAGRAFGSPTSRIRLVVFTDFECPFCRRFHEVAGSLLARYPRDLSLVLVHFPLANHRFALPAARAAECAGRIQGRFLEMADALFKKQDSLGLKSWSGYAREAGIKDAAAFERCANETTRLATIEAGLAAGKRVGLRGTPAVLLNGWYYGVPPDLAELSRAIDDLLMGKAPYPGMPRLRTGKVVTHGPNGLQVARRQ